LSCSEFCEGDTSTNDWRDAAATMTPACTPEDDEPCQACQQRWALQKELDAALAKRRYIIRKALEAE
jgi:hypothetical protein